MLRTIVLYLLAIGLLVACAGSSDQDSAPAVDDQSASPLSSPLAEPEEQGFAHPPLPEVTEGKAVVGGRLTADFGRGGFEPVSLTPMWLAPAIYTDDGKPAFLGLDQVRDPSATSDPEGNFAFADVEPGMYGVVVLHGVQFYLLEDADTGARLIYQIEPDQVLDLQDVRTDLPTP